MAKQGVLPFSRFFAKNSRFGSPTGGLILHWIFGTIALLAVPFGRGTDTVAVLLNLSYCAAAWGYGNYTATQKGVYRTTLIFGHLCSCSWFRISHNSLSSKIQGVDSKDYAFRIPRHTGSVVRPVIFVSYRRDVVAG